MDKRGNLQNVGYPVFFTPGAIAKLSFICDGEVTIHLQDRYVDILKSRNAKGLNTLNPAKVQAYWQSASSSQTRELAAQS